MNIYWQSQNFFKSDSENKKCTLILFFTLNFHGQALFTRNQYIGILPENTGKFWNWKVNYCLGGGQCKG
jgi:hypothetical protein